MKFIYHADLADSKDMENNDTPSDITPPSAGNEENACPEGSAGSLPSGQTDRRSGDRRSDRRAVMDRRSGLDRRRGPGRRRSEDRRSAEEGEMTAEQFEFVMAVNEYKEVNHRPFPTWTEILDIITALGYRKVEQKRDIS
ncbi:MAG: hypothetical protein EHM48_08365 [Planctomycetaceae bacterium]|nr:MAG: hypothetical protein EHM48_08365 [Planctomycetaceae bacterium]